VSTKTTLHLIDTCVLVNIRDVHKDSDACWEKLRHEIENDRLKSVRQVWDELDRRFHPVFVRIKDMRKKLLIPDGELYSAEVAAEIRAMHRAHSGLYDILGAGNPADPWLIGAAKMLNAVVVTDEKSSGPGHKSKIPFVCTSRNVGWLAGRPYLKSIGYDG
jgi:Domain of unknown function (DUF4411)